MNFTRRGLLSAAAATAGSGLAAKQARAVPPVDSTLWRNWSGGVVCRPSARAAPASEETLTTLLRRNASSIRPVGAGHSFTPLVCTEGTLLSLDRLDDVRLDGEEALCGAGVRLGALSRKLAESGRALPNLPDIDRQTLAGACATATHGTGTDFPCLSAQITGMRLITANGEVIRCSPKREGEIFRAAQVSLGALGIISAIRLKTRSAFRLHRRTWFERYDELLPRAADLFARHRNFEFYFLPFTGYCIAITHDETDSLATPRPPSADEDGLWTLKFLRDWFSYLPPLREWFAARAISTAPEENTIGESWQLLSSQRLTRFNEMEYHLPADKGITALDEIVTLLETRRDVFFPVECRLTAPDNAWLSPFDQPRISIAVHAHNEDAHDYFFSLLEPVFRKYGGRPHWGKMHRLGAADFAALYPRWNDFLRVRRELDPRGRFLNPHLRDVLGVSL